MNENLENKIISVAYGDAGLIDKIKIYWLSKNNDEIKELLKKYKASAEKFRNLEEEEIPGNIITNVNNITQNLSNNNKSLLFDLYSLVFRRPAITSAILGIFILAIVSTFVFKRSEIKEQYTIQEIEQADKNVKKSLALIANIFNKTKIKIEKDILTEKVGTPIHKGINVVNDLFIGEHKNEKLN